MIRDEDALNATLGLIKKKHDQTEKRRKKHRIIPPPTDRRKLELIAPILEEGALSGGF